MRSRAAFALGLALCLTPVAAAVADEIGIGQWRTEPGKSLVCGGEEGHTIVTIAKRANAFYLSGAKKSGPEFEAYWSFLEKNIKERRCFATLKMRHLPDAVIYQGPVSLEQQGKRFKVIGTTIEEDSEKYPAFTMTTLRIRPRN